MKSLLFFCSFIVLGLSSMTGYGLGGRKPANDACPQIVIRQKITPPLNASERRWLCGDPESAAYKEVPLYQAAFHLRSFLDNRGYLKAELKIQNDVLLVDPGEPIRLKTVEVTPNETELVQIAERQKGKILRPALLNTLESTLQRRQLETGYPCASVTSQARAEHATLTVIRGAQKSFSLFRPDAIPGLRPEALTRFQPFDRNALYDIRLIELYEKRLLRDNVVQGTYFKDSCKVENSPLEQSFLLGPPRTLRFGVGVDTENGPLLQTSWRNHRFSDMAAQASVTLQASITHQSFTARTEYFPWYEHARFSLNPQLRVARTVSGEAIEVSNSIDTLASRSWDFLSAKWTLSAGPAFISNWYKTDAGRRFQQESSAALLARAEYRTHSFETFDAHPQRGSLVGLASEYRDPALGFKDKTFKASADARTVFPLGLCGNGQCVGAVRLLGSNTWTSVRLLEDLPPSLKTTLGGYANLRGYGLNSLPNNDGLEALSSLSTGIELRGPNVFISQWEPYLFFDIGSYGLESMKLLEGPYSAYGVGVRWNSPIGLLQAYLSRPSTGSFYAYAALGGEF